jgi:hypothetical protein
VSLSFTIISDDSKLLKKSGFSLINILVKLFSKTIEKIRDEEEEEEDGDQSTAASKEKKRIKDYLENPLLLE